MKYLTIIYLCLAPTSIPLFSQTSLHFTPFKGTVYDIQGQEIRGYTERYTYFDVLGEVTLDRLDVPKTNDFKNYFPGTYQKLGIGIVFISTVEVGQTGCYEFSLNSDDGSVLWINDVMVVNNDGLRKMTLKADTTHLLKGVYPVKVWYFNGAAPEFGLILSAKQIPDSVSCVNEKSSQKIELNNVLFEFNASELSAEGVKELNKACIEINKRTFKKVRIIGYTDHVGSDSYNKELSLRRAQSVMKYIKANLDRKDVVFETEGRGSVQPVSTGNSADTRVLNRRVEIYLE